MELRKAQPERMAVPLIILNKVYLLTRSPQSRFFRVMAVNPAFCKYGFSELSEADRVPSDLNPAFKIPLALAVLSGAV